MLSQPMQKGFKVQSRQIRRFGKTHLTRMIEAGSQKKAAASSPKGSRILFNVRFHNKKGIDGRKLDRRTREELRIPAVRLVIEEAKSPEDVVAALGFHRSSMYDWLRRYREVGWGTLKDRRLPGRRRTVNEDLEEKLLRIVTERSPEE